jgi:plastocyanin
MITILFNLVSKRISSLLIVVLLSVGSLGAAEFQISVVDPKGDPIEGAVAWVQGSGEKPEPPREVEIIQKEQQFTPEVTIIPVGSTVSFPNLDSVQHHVYSFSHAKKFDIPLYIGKSPAILFESPGVVTLGCNIHDWMAAYVLILDTRNHATTGADGQAALKAPGGVKGKTRIQVWHPRLRDKPVEAEVAPGETTRVTLRPKPVFRRTPPENVRTGYR